MREVAIVGIGMTPVDEHWDKSIRDLAAEAVILTLQDAQRESVDALYIGNMLSGLISQQENLGALVADWAGLRHTEAVKIEAACSSGAAAVRQAAIAVASGYIDSAIAVGVEKMTEAKGTEITAALATAADADYEVAHGVSFVGLNALIMQRYMYEYGWQHKDFAPFSINAHHNAITNPFARLQEEIDEQDYAKAKMIAYPINLLDASPTGDGAAAVLIIPSETLRKNGQPIIKIAGSAATTDSVAIHDRKDPLWLKAAEISAHKAYSQAGIKPDDIDFFELHDAFSIISALSLEACGFAERGNGPRLALDGQITLTGKLPITTMGGLKARGHPVGASGVYQIVEAVLQLRGMAGQNQVPDARIGMTQNIGGSGSNIITHILVKE